MNFEEEKNDDGKSEENHTEASENTPSSDRFTEFLFGTRRPYEKETNNDTNHSPKNTDQKDQIDYFTLMEQIDDIMVSIENLKPMFKQFAPIVEYIKKKYKKDDIS